MRTLPEPDRARKPIWIGEFTPGPAQRARRASPSKSGESQPPDFTDGGLPIVEIEAPEVWRLEDVVPSPSPEVVAKQAEADFYVVRLQSSLRPERNGPVIEWARLVVQLVSDAPVGHPVAFDVHPLLVTRELRRGARYALAPSLKFQEIELGLGEAAVEVGYDRLEPVISASGVGGSHPSWDFESTSSEPLQGSKRMHMVVKAPKGARTGKAKLDLKADLERDGWLLPAFLRSKPNAEETSMTVDLWGTS